MKEKLTRGKITLNCDPKELLKCVFDHSVKKSKENAVNCAEKVTVIFMYELANILCPDAGEFVFSLFTKEFGWKE